MNVGIHQGTNVFRLIRRLNLIRHVFLLHYPRGNVPRARGRIRTGNLPIKISGVRFGPRRSVSVCSRNLSLSDSATLALLLSYRRTFKKCGEQDLNLQCL